MRPDERERLRQRFQFRCGYCGVSERDVGAELTVDHFQPRSRSGAHDADNWVYCCHACNEFKGDFWAPRSAQRILHPVRDDLARHLIEQDDGTLLALSETGTFHIARLRLNRDPLVAYRRERRRLEDARQTQARLVARLEEIEREMQNLVARLESLERDSDV
jgi:hypothetical protein